MIEFDEEQVGAETVVVRPRGRFTMVSAARFKDLVGAAVDAGRVQVVVDLDGTEFMDSSALGALVAGLKRTRQAGGDLRIARPSAAVRTVLELTSMDRVLRSHASVEDALAPR